MSTLYSLFFPLHSISVLGLGSGVNISQHFVSDGQSAHSCVLPHSGAFTLRPHTVSLFDSSQIMNFRFPGPVPQLFPFPPEEDAAKTPQACQAHVCHDWSEISFFYAPTCNEF